MNPKIWFIHNEGQVTGPYDHDEIESKASQHPEMQIWGRGQGEWVSLAKWRQNLKEIPAPVKADLEVQQLWKARINGQERAPMAYDDLLSLLRAIPDLSNVYVAAEPQGTWKEVYAVERVIDDLGVSRRAHPRVPIVGSLHGESETKGEFTCRVISVSEGGFGVNDAKNLQIGEKFMGTLTSPNLYVTINCTCEVVYVGSDGYAGIRFVGLPAEYKTSIVEYVNKFATG
ncbi:PilZ domain-containing protein [Bdellovibrio sp. HCB2-146]|uniref:PilZ domain-containing protein n=1 Tax=Bdellovibrio sp. HCB2-146 TaxID=3394362 RepID=UPI0039BCD15C